MIQHIGKFENLALFSDGTRAVVIDTSLNLVTNVDYRETLLSSQEWLAPEEEPNEDILTLALGALRYLDNSITASAGSRMYTIPGGVQREAKKALEWRKKHKRGGTPVGMNTARRLAKGGQIGIEKIRHIAKYFPRHEVDKKATGWSPGEDKFPSNGRIAWALWGGDAGQRWASAIVERENKKEKATTAGGQNYGPEVDLILKEQPERYSADTNAFKMAHELDPYYGPEFMARVRLDNSGIDRLYKIEIDGKVYIWDGSAWDNLGHVDGDIYFYDSELDEPNDYVEKTHVLIDPSSAVIISAFLQERPFQPVLLEEIDPEETQMMYDGLFEEDFSMIDRVITAAGESSSTDKDGNYTPEERSENASKQVRDATGRFAKVGQRVAVGGDTQRGAGTIVAVDAKNGLVDVELDSGKTVTIASKYSQPLKSQMTRGNAIRVSNNENAPLDMSGILGEPRTPYNQPKAHLPGTLPPLTDDELRTLLEDFPKYVRNMRRSYKPSSKADKERVKKEWGVDKFKEASLLAAATEDGEELTPETTDVPAKYLALVSPDDKTAVMDLVALVPASSTSTEPMIYERKDGQWQKNEQILRDLKSTTPPPVVPLRDKKILNEVLLQVDDIKEPMQASAYALAVYWEKAIEPILAAGGLDRNRGNAEALRRYWTKGKGALKIRWGTPGDWKRCVRQLSKYMGPRAKGYCQLRHKEATGVYTGSRFNPGRKKSLANMSSLFSTEQEFNEAMIEKSRLSAVASDARQKMGLTAAGSYTSEGAKFFIPMLVPEELESGDGRKFREGSISVRELPVPLLWQIKTGAGHDGSVVVGRIDYIERIEGGMGNAYGVFDNGPYGREAERLVRNGFLRGVSVDLDQFEAKEDKSQRKEAAEDGDNEIGKDKLTINKARIMAATIVAKPAFQECTIEIQDGLTQEDSVTPEDGVYEESVQDFSDVEPILASGFLKSEVPITPPAEWFANPGFTKPTPLTVDEDGRVYGHIAAWNVSHIGLPRSTKPPRSRSKYAYFNTGVIRTAEGTDIPVGQLTLAGGHAPLNANAAAAAKHYDDTASAVADIHVGEDEYGIWCAGSIRPGLDEMQIRALRASAPSGDWRPINGSLELVAICQVNVPGFPTARAMVASGKILALVAAGASEMALLKSNAYHSLAIKAELLSQLNSKSEEILNRAASQFGYMNKETREKLAKEGKAMKDGSFPIRNVEDLKNAIQAHGRAKDVEAAKKHIMKRARILKRADLIPDEWSKPKTTASALAVSALREKALVAAALAEFAKFSDEERMKLADKGFALPDGSFPIRNEDDLRNAIRAYGRAEKTKRVTVRKHIMKRARALRKEYLIPEDWTNAGSAEAKSIVASMRSRIAEFAKAPKDEEISDEELEELKKAKEEAEKQTEEEIKAAEEVKSGKAPTVDRDEDGRPKYVSGVNQPRDAKGKYRKVLARLKQDLGVAGLSRALKKAEAAENLDFAGDYAASAGASAELLDMIDRLDANALNPEALENVRLTAAELGKTIANLPLPFGKDAEKIKFSDLPAGLKDLIDQMITRVEAKIGKKDADIATQSLKSYMSGADVYSQGEVQSEMSKLLRLLT